MSRLRVAVVGQASAPSLIRVGLDRAAVDALSVRSELIAKASAKLGISPPDLDQVRPTHAQCPMPNARCPTPNDPTPNTQ
jgi:hypothetical protein